MKVRPDRAAAAKWWIICLAGVILAEAGVCLLLFIPQSRALAKAKRDAETIEDQVGKLGLTTFKASFNELSNKVDRADENLRRLQLFRADAPQEVIINAIAEVNASARVLLTELKPIVENPPASSAAAAKAKSRKRRKGTAAQLTRVGIGHAWRLRCRGGFRDMVAFLNGIEQRGVMMDADPFTVAVARGADAIDVEVQLRVFPEDSLDKLAAQRAAAKKTDPAGEGGKTSASRRAKDKG